MHIIEKGATFNKPNKTMLKQFKDWINSLALDDSDSEDVNTKEAATWSLADTSTAIQKALAANKANRYAYLQDIFPEESLAVYQIGWPGKYYQCSYSLDNTGVATLGEAIEVNRKVSYVEVSQDTPNIDTSSVDSYESTEVEIKGDQVQLVEKAVNNDGITMLKLISPGLGSSGYYSESVLKQAAANKVFSKGLHNLIDHPTATEEAARPEGSLNNLGSTLVEDATWRDDYHGHGPGLYAKAKVVPGFAEKLNVIAGDIGTSIRAVGKAHLGEVNGKQVPIIDTIEQAKSVDYVTMPGRGGKVLELLEANRIGANSMTVTDEQYNQLAESNKQLSQQLARLMEGQALQSAEKLVEAELRQYPSLPKPTRDRLLRELPSAFKLSESGTLDTEDLKAKVTSAVTAEFNYLASLGIGSIADLGGKPISEAVSLADLEKEINENINAI